MTFIESNISHTVDATYTEAGPLTADNLRDTAAGRALMAEAWEMCRRSVQNDPDALDVLPNPYRESK